MARSKPVYVNVRLSSSGGGVIVSDLFCRCLADLSCKDLVERFLCSFGCGGQTNNLISN